MKKVIALTLFVLSLSFHTAIAQSPPCGRLSTCPPVGSLSGSEFFPVVQNGQNYRALINQIPTPWSGGLGLSGQVLTSNGPTTPPTFQPSQGGGGGATPGGLPTQPQYNVGGTSLGGLTAFYVQAYGAKCDGTIIYAGVHTTSGSKTISTAAHTFTSKDVGAIITLTNPAPVNGYSSSAPTAFISTIASVSGGNAVLANNVTFTSSGYYAAARFYHTVDTTAIQGALNAANTVGGGEIIFPPGVCASGNLTMYSNETIKGSNVGASVIMLANGSNSDLITGYNFSSLTGTNDGGGIAEPTFDDIQLDGNRGANTGSGIGTPTGTGDGIRFYGYEPHFKNLYINYFAADGWYSEWSNTAGEPIADNGNAGPDSMLSSTAGEIKSFYNAGWGIIWGGPHDSKIDHVTVAHNGTGGFLNTRSGDGSPLSILVFHGYDEPFPDIDAETPYFACDACLAETGIILNNFNMTLTNVRTPILWLGQSISGSPVYGLSMVGVNVQTTLFNYSASGGFNDEWVNSIIAAISGSGEGSYVPNYSSNTIGLDNNIGGNGTYLVIRNYPSNIVRIGTSSASIFTMTNGNFDAANDANGDWAFGPLGSSAPSSLYVGFDLSSNITGELLPTGTTGQRSSSPTPGEARYNSTTHAFEVYQGSSAAWVSLVPTGTSGATVPLNNGGFTQSGTSIFTGPVEINGTNSLTFQFNGFTYPVILSQDTNSNFTINDNVNVLWLNASGAVSLGPSATTVTTDVGLDLSAFKGATQSDVLLPSDTTSNRPTTPTVGMIRYNTTTNALEVYEGSLAAWVSLGGGVSCSAGTVNLTTEVVTNGIVTHC